MRFARVALVGLVLVASSAWAQKVVVLELDGDSGNKLHAQIESALRRAGAVEVLSIEKYKENAAKKKLKGGAAMTPAGVARTAKLMKIDAAVTGEVTATTYKVVIYDALGQELWTKSLPVKKGLLTDDFAVKLARAIAAAAEQGIARASVTPIDDPGPSTTTSSGSDSPEVEGIDLTDTGPSSGRVDSSSGRTGGSAVVTPPDDPARDTDLDAESSAKKHYPPGPPLFRVLVAGTTTWRAQCLRPGVTNCKEYDALNPKPLGIQIDFTASVPYLGLTANAEIFPLARMNSRWVQGLGLLANISYGASVTKIIEASDQGTAPEKRINSTDIGWTTQLAYRVHFNTGMGDPQPVSYAGLRGGLQGRTFNIDPNAGVSLPSSQRFLFPALGADVSIGILKYLRVELSFSYFINPKVGPDQIVGYGNATDITGGVVSRGLGIEGGLAGELWGPIGWQVRARYVSFADQYYGGGTKWTVCRDATATAPAQCGGAAEESYTSLLWGLTASY